MLSLEGKIRGEAHVHGGRRKLAWCVCVLEPPNGKGFGVFVYSLICILPFFYPAGGMAGWHRGWGGAPPGPQAENSPGLQLLPFPIQEMEGEGAAGKASR